MCTLFQKLAELEAQTRRWDGFIIVRDKVTGEITYGGASDFEKKFLQGKPFTEGPPSVHSHHISMSAVLQKAVEAGKTAAVTDLVVETPEKTVETPTIEHNVAVRQEEAQPLSSLNKFLKSPPKKTNARKRLTSILRKNN